jgi:shikimate dehydrogenase
MHRVEWISGRTRLFGIVGDPVAQVRSPELMTAALHARGTDAILVPIHIPAEAFDATVSGLKAVKNLDGLVLTIPFKARALGHVDIVGPEGQAGGGINAMVRCPDGTWQGEMFDGLGCLAALRSVGTSPRDRSILLIGAGGAGAAIGLAVARHAPARLRIAELDATRAADLMRRIHMVVPQVAVETGPADPTDFDMVLNASPVGMADDPGTPLLASVTPDTVVFDAVATPAITRMMAEAITIGATVVGGAEMIRGQTNLIIDFMLQYKSTNSRTRK